MFLGWGGGGQSVSVIVARRAPRGPPPPLLSKTSQICHIFILLHGAAASALGAGARPGV